MNMFDAHSLSTLLPLVAAAALAVLAFGWRPVARVPVPVAIEPPPMSFVVGSMPLFTFFGELSRATGCALLLELVLRSSEPKRVTYLAITGMERF